MPGCCCTQAVHYFSVFSHCRGNRFQLTAPSQRAPAANNASTTFKSLSSRTPTPNCPCNAYQRCQSQLERKERAISPLRREQKMEGRQGSPVSPESSTDGFISKFKNRQEGRGRGTPHTLTFNVLVCRYAAKEELEFMHSDNMKSIRV